MNNDRDALLHGEKDGNIKPSRKKPTYPVGMALHSYLKNFGREVELPVSYQDLMHFTYSIPLKDKNGKETLWEKTLYDIREWEYIREGLIKTYAILKTEGDFSFIRHLDVARIDYCTFGNSNPFRIRIVNKYNDNYDHYYIKIADASRIYGLELEHILTSNRIKFLTCKNTLVEEHIAGIPGDVFISHMMNEPETNKIRLAKEFVKFNERCFVRLLGDMRSYNFVVDITPDIEDYQYRIRSIDFDQQSYEGARKMYLPQFFKDNFKLVELSLKYLNNDSIGQYQMEERTIMAFRVASSRYRIMNLLTIMGRDKISTEQKIAQLKKELSEFTGNTAYLKCKTMGQIVKTHLKFYLQKNLKQIHKMTDRLGD
jgi:hypothetical protein